MNYNDALNYISKSNENGNRIFIVNINGKRNIKRLFVYKDTLICEFARKSRKKGFPVNTVDKWESISEYKHTKSDVDRLRYLMSKIVKYLNESGLWIDFKNSFEKLLSFDDDTLNKLLTCDYDSYNEFIHKHDITISCDCFSNLLHKGIKTINYSIYEKGYIDTTFNNAIKNKLKYSYKWRKGYDNSIECKYNEANDYMMAWYSEEYKGCLNGYYYIALDNKHALFMEKD